MEKEKTKYDKGKRIPTPTHWVHGEGSRDSRGKLHLLLTGGWTIIF